MATACLVFAPKSFAIFGVGDITFDPSNYAILIETKLETAARWSEEVLKYEKMIQQQIEQIEKAKSCSTARTHCEPR
ncbi:hypothetical protein [Termitidicoccus mucosus]|uniref:hypothetical protein n=1 Tax=Termitidicoccus mucosus TaxID=1184151 RepID=UPI003182E171